MLEPDILNPGLHLNVTESPNDCLSTVLTLLLTFPGFPHDAGLREEVEPRENEKPGQSQNKVDLTLLPFVHHKVKPIHYYVSKIGLVICRSINGQKTTAKSKLLINKICTEESAYKFEYPSMR